MLDCFHWDLNRYRLNFWSWNKRLSHRRQWVSSTVKRSQPTLLVSLSWNWFVRENLIIDLVAQWCVCRVVISTGVGCWLCWLRWGFVDWLLYGRVMISDWWLLHGRVMISDRLYNRCRVILHRFMNNRCRFLDNLMQLLRCCGFHLELLLSGWLIPLDLLLNDLWLELMMINFLMLWLGLVVMFWGWRNVSLFAHPQA